MSMHRDSTSEWSKEKQSLKTITTSKPSKVNPPILDRKSTTFLFPN
ncbi:hypothetical protein Ga0466249_002376 [Sporomusaceae bacterium BoRhaA]|nr:hypothetical protein [Pelorhabdus rhamnosifermentans]